MLTDTLSAIDTAHTAALGLPRREFDVYATVQSVAREFVQAYRADGGPDGDDAIIAFLASLEVRRADIVRAYADAGDLAAQWADEVLAEIEFASGEYDAAELSGDEATIGFLSPALDDMVLEVGP